jgi:hypothetical protein
MAVMGADMKFALSRLSVIVTASACLSGFGAAPAGLAVVSDPAQPPPSAPSVRLAGAASDWRVAARVTIPGKRVVMVNVAAASPDDAWAIGFANGRDGGAGRSVVERWSRDRWRRVPVPASILAAFDAGGLPYAVLRASSPSNVWAFNQQTGAWLRWNGSRWSEGLVGRRAGRLATPVTSALVLSRDSVWAFGGRVNQQGALAPFAAHFDGRTWSMTPISAKLQLPVSAASAVSPRSIWALIGMGSEATAPPGPAGGLMMHWNGRRWRRVTLPAALARHGDPTSIDAVSRSDIWVGGGEPNGRLGLTETAAHWTGTAWQVVSLPAAASPADCVLGGIVADGRAGAQGLGLCFTSEGPGINSRLWRLSDQRWTAAPQPHLASPSSILEIASAGRATAQWAAGFAGNTGILAVRGQDPS